jgi:hypothetical protein
VTASCSASGLVLEIKLNGEDLLIMNESDIMGVIATATVATIGITKKKAA